jgi:hypothetical protein
MRRLDGIQQTNRRNGMMRGSKNGATVKLKLKPTSVLRQFAIIIKRIAIYQGIDFSYNANIIVFIATAPNRTPSDSLDKMEPVNTCITGTTGVQPSAGLAKPSKTAIKGNDNHLIV